MSGFLPLEQLGQRDDLQPGMRVAHSGLGGDCVAAADYLVEGVLGMVVPVPGILKHLDLRVGAVAGLRLEQDVVIGIRIEGRVRGQ